MIGSNAVVLPLLTDRKKRKKKTRREKLGLKGR